MLIELLPYLLLGSLLGLVLGRLCGGLVRRVELGLWREFCLVLHGLVLPQWLLRRLVPPTVSPSLRPTSIVVEWIKIRVSWPWAWSTSSVGASLELHGLHTTFLGSSLSTDGHDEIQTHPIRTTRQARTAPASKATGKLCGMRAAHGAGSFLLLPPFIDAFFPCSPPQNRPPAMAYQLVSQALRCSYRRLGGCGA